MRIARTFALPIAGLALLALAGCDQIINLAGTAGKEAAKVAAQTVDTQTACTLAGQNEAFCGCLQTELGAKIDPANIDALAKVLKDAVTSGGNIEQAAQSAAGVDQKTKDAVVKCAVRGAVGAAEQEAAGQ